MKKFNIYIEGDTYQVEVKFEPLIFCIRNLNCPIPYKVGLKDDGTWFRLPDQSDGAEHFSDKRFVEICTEIQTYIN